jgi:hypothetical protein
MRRKNERKAVIVDGSVQAKIVLATSLPMIGCLLLAVAVQFWYERQLSQGHIAAEGTIFGMPVDRLGMLVLFVGCATVQVVSALLSSHKVAGASLRIASVLHSFRDGDRSARVHLRRGDYQQSLANEINGLLDWVESAPDAPRGDQPSRARTGAPGRPEAAATRS